MHRGRVAVCSAVQFPECSPRVATNYYKRFEGYVLDPIYWVRFEAWLLLWLPLLPPPMCYNPAMFEELTKNKKPNSKRLEDYGFIKEQGHYAFQTHILENSFLLCVTIDETGLIETHLFDIENGDEYTLYKTSAAGEYVGSIREEIRLEIAKIVGFCYENSAFQFPQTVHLLSYVKERYGDEPEFPWDDVDGAVFRKKSNRKWYALVMTVKKDRLGLEGDGSVEVVNLKYKFQELPDNLKSLPIMPAYHMNKKTWVTVVLDGRVPDANLFRMLDQSYDAV